MLAPCADAGSDPAPDVAAIGNTTAEVATWRIVTKTQTEVLRYCLLVHGTVSSFPNPYRAPFILLA